MSAGTPEFSDKLEPNTGPAADQNLTNYAFVNTSNPTKVADPKTQRFVRQQVQRKYKKAVPHNEGSENFPDPEPSDLPFVNISNPSQASSAGAKRFVRQQVQLRYQKQLSALSQKEYAISSDGEKQDEKPNEYVSAVIAPAPPTGAMEDYCQEFQISNDVEIKDTKYKQAKITHLGARIDHSNIVFVVASWKNTYYNNKPNSCAVIP